MLVGHFFRLYYTFSSFWFWHNCKIFINQFGGISVYPTCVCTLCSSFQLLFLAIWHGFLFFFQPSLTIFSIDISLRGNRHLNTQCVKNDLIPNCAYGPWMIMCSKSWNTDFFFYSKVSSCMVLGQVFWIWRFDLGPRSILVNLLMKQIRISKICFSQMWAVNFVQSLLLLSVVLKTNIY